MGYNLSMITKILLFISIFLIVRKIIIYRLIKEIHKINILQKINKTTFLLNNKC